MGWVAEVEWVHDKWPRAGETHLLPKSRPQLPDVWQPLGPKLEPLSRAPPADLQNKNPSSLGVRSAPVTRTPDARVSCPEIAIVSDLRRPWSDPAAIDDVVLVGAGAAVVGGEEEDDAGDVVRHELAL